MKKIDWEVLELHEKITGKLYISLGNCKWQKRIQTVWNYKLM